MSNPVNVEWADAMVPFCELQKLSGLERPTAIAAWLGRIHVSYSVDPAGRPFTSTSAFGKAMMHKGKPKQAKEVKGVNLNW